MRRLKRPMIGSIAGLLMTLAVVALVPSAKRTWVRLSGAVVAGGSRTHSYADKPARVLSVEGRRWVTWNESEGASAYHALVIFPRGELKDLGGVSGGDGFTYTRAERWHVREWQPQTVAGEEIRLGIAYDAFWRTVTVDSQAYRLADGNMFVIRFDKQRGLSVTQLNMTVDKGAGIDEVVGAFKSKLPEDEVAQQL
jgi:hypothetical protein